MFLEASSNKENVVFPGPVIKIRLARLTGQIRASRRAIYDPAGLGSAARLVSFTDRLRCELQLTVLAVSSPKP